MSLKPHVASWIYYNLPSPIFLWPREGCLPPFYTKFHHTYRKMSGLPMLEVNKCKTALENHSCRSGYSVGRKIVNVLRHISSASQSGQLVLPTKLPTKHSLQLAEAVHNSLYFSHWLLFLYFHKAQRKGKPCPMILAAHSSKWFFFKVAVKSLCLLH